MIYLRNIVYFILMVLFGFFMGIQYANIIEAGKGQMLAGGAIVLGYGVMGAGILLLLAIFLYYQFRKKEGLIKKINIALFLLVIGFFIFFKVKYDLRKAKENKSVGINQIKRVDPTSSTFLKI